MKGRLSFLSMPQCYNTPCERSLDNRTSFCYPDRCSHRCYGLCISFGTTRYPNPKISVSTESTRGKANDDQAFTATLKQKRNKCFLFIQRGVNYTATGRFSALPSVASRQECQDYFPEWTSLLFSPSLRSRRSTNSIKMKRAQSENKFRQLIRSGELKFYPKKDSEQ